MERSNNIDDLMRQRLRHAEVPPPAFVWPNVEQALRRRKRRFLIWFFAIGMASGLTGMAVWAFWPQAKPVAERPVAGKPFAKLRSAAPSFSETTLAPRPETVIPDQQTSRAEIQRSATSSSGQHQLTARTKAVPSVKTSRVPLPGQTVLPIQTLPESTTNTLPIGQQTPALAVETTEQQPVAGTNAGIGFTARLPGLEPGLLDFSRPKPAMAPVKLPAIKAKKTQKKCYDFHTNRQAWLVDAYAGPSWANMRLHTADSELDDYLQDRERTEKRDWGFNAGIRASYLFAGNFIVRSGLHYDQYMEQFEYIDPDFIRYNITITQKLINGQWVSVTDTVGIEYGTDYLKSYNRFAMLDIPLQAALELRSGPTGVSLNLGGSLNVLFHKRGSMLTPSGKPASFTPSDAEYDVFRTRLGMSLMGSIQWFYHLSPRTRVFVEPYYRHVVEPVTRSVYPVEQSQGVGGVRFGVTRIFD